MKCVKKEESVTKYTIEITTKELETLIKAMGQFNEGYNLYLDLKTLLTKGECN